MFRLVLVLWLVLLSSKCFKQILPAGQLNYYFHFSMALFIKFGIFFLNRPTVDQCLNDDFMTQGYMPSRLPLSCLTMPPRFDPRLNNSLIAVRRPLGEINRDSPLISNEVQGIMNRPFFFLCNGLLHFSVLLQASRANQLTHQPLPTHHFRPFHQAHRLSNCSVTCSNNFSNFSPRNPTRKFHSSWVRLFSNSAEGITHFIATLFYL